MTEAKKDDAGKLRYDLLPVEALQEVVRAFTVGVSKYGDRNWEQGMDWGRVYGAAMRHLNAFWAGEDIDRDDGQHHLAAAGWCVLVLLQYAIMHAGNDTRSRMIQKCATCHQQTNSLTSWPWQSLK